ncbi:MAG: type II toxin-antitoxin system VapC family toxin [Candidatus Micrarchaeota archaeon]
MPYADSNIFIAYFNVNDYFHQRSLKLMEELRGKEFKITLAVVFEVVNYMLKRRGKAAASDALLFFRNAPNVELIFEGKASWEETLKLFNKYELSLTDAEIAASMGKRGENELYTFDTDFEQFGWIKIKK